MKKDTFAFMIGSGFVARKNGWNDLHGLVNEEKSESFLCSFGLWFGAFRAKFYYEFHSEHFEV